MHRLLPKLAALLGFCTVAAAQDPPGWTLVWADEFEQADGSPPDPAKWGHDTGGSGWGNNELQYYTSRTENARIEDGHLVIEARSEEFGGRNYTSARLLTKGKRTWTYGRFEARLRVPRGQGMWPALWMLGADFDSVGWPDCGEIDIMEHIGGQPGTVHGTLHGPGYSGTAGLSGSHTLPAGEDVADDFHLFAMEWEENRIRWFIDGQPYFTLTPQDLPAGATWVFDRPHFLLLNVAVGGNWPGNPNASTSFPQRMTVDYVRVYERDGDAAGNLLENPGFESGMEAWNSFGEPVSVEDAWPHHGGHSLKASGASTGSLHDSGVHQELPSSSGTAYRADGWLLTPPHDRIAGVNSAWLEVSFHDSGGEILALHRSGAMTSADAPGTWRHFEVNRQVDPVSGALVDLSPRLVAPHGTSSVRKRLRFRQITDAAGSVRFDDLRLVIDDEPEPPEEVTLTVDPAAHWRGYMNVYDRPESGGAFRFGQVWATADLRATFQGPVLKLSPNSIGDPSTYWYVGGGAPGHAGNKIMEANLYVEKTGTLSGRAVHFAGTVTSNTWTAAHQSVAFIKDFAPDYSSFRIATVPLVNGRFQVSLATHPASGRHVQYGFQTKGPNVWTTDAASFGSLMVTGVPLDPFVAWVESFDFSNIGDPDLSPTGDPDQDGQDNLMEFALDGNPARAAASGKMRARIEESGGQLALVLTVPARDEARFSGSLAKAATLDGWTQAIEGSSTLDLFNGLVTEIPAATGGLPMLSEGWSYRSFRLEETGVQGFLRMRVAGNH